MQQKTCQQVNLLLLGAPKAGKTSIIKRLIYCEFDAAYEPTLGVTVSFYSFRSKGQTFKAILRDASGTKDNRFLVQMHLHDENLSVIGLVLDGSMPLEEAVILDGLEFVLEQTDTIPIFFLLNKLDLIQKDNRTQQKVLLIQKIHDLLKQKALGDRKVSLHFCSAKTGEGIQTAFDTLLANISGNGAEEKEIKNKAHPALLNPEPDLLTNEPKKPPRLRRLDSSWRETISKLLESRYWIVGNLLILLTITLFVILFFAVGSLSLIGVLPAWAMCVGLASLVLLGWNIGCVLYQDDCVPTQTAQDNPEINDIFGQVTKVSNPEEDVMPQSTPLCSVSTDSISSMTQTTPNHTVCQTPSNLNF